MAAILPLHEGVQPFIQDGDTDFAPKTRTAVAHGQVAGEA